MIIYIYTITLRTLLPLWGPENALLPSHSFSNHCQGKERNLGKIICSVLSLEGALELLDCGQFQLGRSPRVPLPVPSFQKKNKTKLSNNNKNLEE